MRLSFIVTCIPYRGKCDVFYRNQAQCDVFYRNQAQLKIELGIDKKK